MGSSDKQQNIPDEAYWEKVRKFQIEKYGMIIDDDTHHVDIKKDKQYEDPEQFIEDEPVYHLVRFNTKKHNEKVRQRIRKKLIPRQTVGDQVFDLFSTYEIGKFIYTVVPEEIELSKKDKIVASGSYNEITGKFSKSYRGWHRVLIKKGKIKSPMGDDDPIFKKQKTSRS